LKEKTKTLLAAGLAIRAVKLNTENPFLWASGYFMPIYTDNRIFLKDKRYRSLIAESFAEIIAENNITVDVIAGTSTAGIPHATTLADALNLPLTYVRKEPKDHGLHNRIEGIHAEEGYRGKNVLLIEDLVSTGGSSIEAVKAIREAGGMIEYCLSIFSYGLKKAEKNFASLSPRCRMVPILTYDELITTACEKGYIGKKTVSTLLTWRHAPFSWGSSHGFFPRKKGDSQ